MNLSSSDDSSDKERYIMSHPENQDFSAISAQSQSEVQSQNNSTTKIQGSLGTPTSFINNLPQTEHPLSSFAPNKPHFHSQLIELQSKTHLTKKFTFLSPDKRNALKIKFTTAKTKILENQSMFLERIRIGINNNDIKEITSLMLNKDNQRFYKRQLDNPHFLNSMLMLGHMEMLSAVLKDPFYQFKETFVFEHLSKKLKEKDKLLNQIESISEFINNVVNYNLYRKSLTKVLGWFIISFGLNESFIYLVQNNEKEYSLEYIQYNRFETEEDIKDYFSELENYKRVLILCVKERLEQLAIELISYKGQLENSEVIETAVQYNSKTFLRFIWETTNHLAENKGVVRRRTAKSLHKSSVSSNIASKHIQTIFETSIHKTVFNQGNKVFMISELIDRISKLNNQDMIHEIVSVWKFLDKDKNLLQELFQKRFYEEIAILIYRYPNNINWKFSTQNFKEVIENRGLELIQLCLQDKDCRHVLEEAEIQNVIIQDYINSGERMYYGAEMLSHIKKTSLDLSLALKLLQAIDVSIKNKSMINCYSPVLTCLLLCEIVSHIGKISVHFYTQCQKTRLELMTFCKNIHEANPNEKYIKFLLGQKDSKGRSGYQIAAETEAYMVLESPEVGTIVNKMWVGRLRDEGLCGFSSLMKYLELATVKRVNPFKEFDPIDPSKTYFHQLCLWEESCSLRYYPESLSTILLIVLYNLYIFFLVVDDVIMVNIKEISLNMQIIVVCYIIWVSCIVANIPLQILYCSMTKKRKFKMDIWNYLEIALCLSSFLVLIDTQQLFPNHDSEGNIIPSDNKSDWAFVIRATILSVNDIFVWLRITGILLTYKELGPLIRMIYLLSIITGKYLLIYLILMICAATLYTTLFYRASPMYESYSVTFTTLFQGYLNNSNVFDFKYYEIFGAICCIAFVTVGGLILVNMLIALLSNEYTRLSKVVDAAHRSVLINYFKRYKWDKNYGYLILLTTPLNIINFFILPINLLFRESQRDLSLTNIDEPIENNDILKAKKTRQKQFNTYVTRVYFTIFYFPIIFMIEFTLSILLVPVCYFFGIFNSFNEFNEETESNFLIKLAIVFGWLFLGFPFLIYIFIRDLLMLFRTIFLSIDVNAYDLEKKRIKEFITPDDIRNFLKFIHKREKTEQNDLHTIFINYLEFEHELMAEMDQDFKNQTNYLQKLRNAGKSGTKKISVSLSSIYSKTINKMSKDNKKEEIGLSDRATKRNLIIIEILENFLIDDGSENFIVDIEKMKLLLPKTMNINNAFIKRLVHTDSASLNKAFNKRKNKANEFLQHKLLNKIVGSIVRLDKVIDAEANYDPLSTDEEKKLNRFDIEENEDDFYVTLEELLKKIGDDVSDNIKGMEEKLLEEESKYKSMKYQKDKEKHKNSL